MSKDNVKYLTHNKNFYKNKRGNTERKPKKKSGLIRNNFNNKKKNPENLKQICNSTLKKKGSLSKKVQVFVDQSTQTENKECDISQF